MENISEVLWQSVDVTSPRLSGPVTVIAAVGIPYVSAANRLQDLNIYLPDTPEARSLIGTPARSLPGQTNADVPRYFVHVHGGAWRDPQLTAASVEPTVAHAFSSPGSTSHINVIVSINYTLSPYPTHPTLPYDPVKNHHSDPSREAVHPQHVRDVLNGLLFLKSFGLADQSYILSGHSCGACIAFQAILQSPAVYGSDMTDAPCPAAIVGLNGLYDLPALVNGLGASHEHLRVEYGMLLSNAFGKDETIWAVASPARFDPIAIAKRVREGLAPRFILLDESTEDQLVPMNQLDRFKAELSKSRGLSVIKGTRCTGKHAAPWEQGLMMWESLQDILTHLHGDPGGRD